MSKRKAKTTEAADAEWDAMVEESERGRPEKVLQASQELTRIMSISKEKGGDPVPCTFAYDHEMIHSLEAIVRRLHRRIVELEAKA